MSLKMFMDGGTPDGRTHYEGCWQDRHHHDCALDHIAALEAELARRSAPVTDAEARYLWCSNERAIDFANKLIAAPVAPPQSAEKIGGGA